MKHIQKSGYTFRSENLHYCPLDETAAPYIVRWRSDPEITRFFFNTKPITMEEHMQWYNNRYLTDETRYDWIVYCDQTPIGTVTLSEIDIKTGSCEIGYSIGIPDYRGRGLGVEMIRAVISFGTERFRLKTFTAYIHRDNAASQRAAVRAGFTLKKSDTLFWRYENNIETT